MISDMFNASQRGVEALLANTRTTPEAVQSDQFSGTPNIPEKKSFGADLFKRNAVSKVTTDDIDQGLIDLVNKKSDAYVDIKKFFNSQGENISPKDIYKGVEAMHKDINTQISNLQSEKSTRLQEAEKVAQQDYDMKSKDFAYQRSRQMELDKQIMNETQQPSSDPQKIADLMKEKEQVDTKVEKVKKYFKANGIEQPEAILREESNKQINTAQDVSQTPGVENLLYDAGMGKYDNEAGQFSPKAFLADIQNIPELKGQPKQVIAEKLLDMDADIPALEDLFYVANSMHDKPDAMVPKFREKGFDDEQIVQIVLNGFAKNANLKTLENGDPSNPKDMGDFLSLKKSLKSYGIKKSIINDVVDSLSE